MSLIVLVIILGCALALSLAFNLGLLGQKPAIVPSASSAAASGNVRVSDDAASRAEKLENELEKKRKEIEEVKKTQGELKSELKDAKKKLHEHKESAKTGDDLVKARAEVERQASLQLETTRSELANALSEMQRLRGELEGKARKPRPATEAAPAASAASAEPKTEEKREVVIQRVIRELSDAEKEKMQRLEQQSASDKKKAIELAAELRNVKSKIDREKREAKRIYEEGRLARDKFRAVEIRLNRTLLENDLLKGAIRGLEAKTGLVAEHPAPTADEIAQSDATIKAKHAAEDKASEEAQAKLEAAEATVGEVPAELAPTVAAEPAPAPSPSV